MTKHCKTQYLKQSKSLCIVLFAQLLIINPSLSFLQQYQYSHNYNGYSFKSNQDDSDSKISTTSSSGVTNSPPSITSSLLSLSLPLPPSPLAPSSRRKRTRCKLRNFDLPEALIFYGIDTIIDRNSNNNDNDHGNDIIKPTVQPGVVRLMKESKEVKTPIIVLSEYHTMDEISSILDSAALESDDTDNLFFTDLNQDDQILHYRSSLEEYILDHHHPLHQKNDDDNDDNDDNDDDEYPPTFLGRGFGHSPSPASLMDAIHTIWIEPRGFGGSSGFGTKYADAVRNPLPQHCVVFVSRSSDDLNNMDDATRNINIGNNGSDGSNNNSKIKYDGTGSISRDRSLACRMAGVRVMYIEGIGGCYGSCTAEDVSDGIVESLGTVDDWSMVTMDDISTPGSFWLNMAQPKGANGDFVNAYDIVEDYEKLRMKDDDNNSVIEGDDTDSMMVSEEMNEGEMESILADLDSL